MIRMVLSLVALLSLASIAQAQTCFFTNPNINFGATVDVLPGAAIATTGTIGITCSGGPNAERYVLLCLSLGPGAPPGTSPTSNPRFMRVNSGGFALTYDFFQNSGRTITWGGVSAAQAAFGGPVALTLTRPAGGLPVSSTVTIYAAIAAGQQAAAPGTYTAAFTTAANITYAYQVYSNTNQIGTCSDAGFTTVTGNFTASATVSANCLISATPALNFGTLAVLTAAIPGTTTISRRCTSGTAYNIGLSAGAGIGATVAARRMTGPGLATVTYSLYKDSGWTTVWGDVGAARISDTGTGLTQTTTVYGRVPAQSTPVAGNYTDTIIVTVTY